MEYLAGVWEFLSFLVTSRRGLSWLLIGLVLISALGALVLG
jgi:hypothetical protein